MSDLIPPGRRTGKVDADIGELFNQAYKTFVTLQQSADGANDSIDGMRKRLTALETKAAEQAAKITALETENASQKAKLDAIAAIEILDFAITDPVTGPEGDALQAAINQILAGARTENSNGSS
jgi:hypothetical protein